MSWRTVIVTRRAKVSYSLGYMVIRGEETRRIFMDEIQTVLLESTAISLTTSWLNQCMQRKIKIIFCDEKRNPRGELISYAGSCDASRCLRKQIAWSPARKEQVWQRIVSEKIRKQAEVLSLYKRDIESGILKGYSRQVELGDATNREGHAAKVYFSALWGMTFSRREESVENGAMNYGYAIILSACNREIVSSGYSTQLGIFHDNTFNPFNLGCDLMEPFRPLVDYKVLSMKPKQMGKEEKAQLVTVLNEKVRIANRKTTVSQAIGIYCRSVLTALEEGKPENIRCYEMMHEE